MKILYVISDENIGGAGVLLCNLLRNLDRSRFLAEVALPKGSALTERIAELDVPTIELEHPCDRFSGGSVRELQRLIRKRAPDIVHANAAVSARVAGRLCGRKVIHTRHCCYPVRDDRQLHPFAYAERIGNRWLSDRAIATAEAAAENLRELGIPDRKISVIINGSEPVREVEEWELEQWRARLGLTAEDFCVGICARLEPCKGHTVFLSAAKIAQRRMPERRFRFLIVGEGSLRAFLEARAEQEGVLDLVRFVGFVSDPAPLYRLFRINVNASCGTETSCLAISEGMSASLPTVASHYGGNRAMIGETGAGICFEVGNAVSLADAICKIASDEALEARMRAAALERYQSQFTAKRMTEQVQELYSSLMR